VPGGGAQEPPTPEALRQPAETAAKVKPKKCRSRQAKRERAALMAAQAQERKQANGEAGSDDEAEEEAPPVKKTKLQRAHHPRLIPFAEAPNPKRSERLCVSSGPAPHEPKQYGTRSQHP
jgi:hypothetical protein